MADLMSGLTSTSAPLSGTTLAEAVRPPYPLIYATPRLGDMLVRLDSYDRPSAAGEEPPQSPAEFVQQLTLAQSRQMLDDAESTAVELRRTLDRLAQVRGIVQEQAHALAEHDPTRDEKLDMRVAL